MRKFAFGTLLLLLGLAACDTTSPSRPSSIEVHGAGGTAPAGNALAAPLTFAVLDQNGRPMADVPITVAVTGGGGTIVGAPAMSASGHASIGTWTLGPSVGANELTLTVDGIAPKTIQVTGVAGPPANLTPLTPTALEGTVGAQVQPAPRARLTDAFGNPIDGAAVTIAVSHGTTADQTIVSAADGAVTIAAWTLGTVSGEQTLTMTAGAATATFTADAAPGPLASLSILAGDGQSAPAGSMPPLPVSVVARDAFGNPIGGLSVAFQVVAGGGTLAAAAATTSASGVVAVPGWTLGRTVDPQIVRATSGSFSVEAHASVATGYSIDVRFFGTPISAQRQALLIDAAKRIPAVVTGDLPAVQATNLSVTECGVSGVAPLNEIIDDLVIFAAIQQIDGPGKVLASAGPCYIRTGGLPVVGVMAFDVDDIAFMETNGIFGDVVLHEMLHVLGFGVGFYWNPLLTEPGTPNVTFQGQSAIAGCAGAGGATACLAGVPVENTGGPGTADSHWRESAFDHELMTGYANVSDMPLSVVTVGGLQDIGYVVNPNGADPYQVPAAGLRLQAPELLHETWERLDPPIFEVAPGGRSAPALSRPNARND